MADQDSRQMAIEVLKATRSGNDLSDKDIDLVYIALKSGLMKGEVKWLSQLHNAVISGTYPNPDLFGLNDLRSDSSCNIFYKGIRVAQTNSRWLATKEAPQYMAELHSWIVQQEKQGAKISYAAVMFRDVAGELLHSPVRAENPLQGGTSMIGANDVLRDKLDACLLAHFDALKQKEQVSVGDLYGLQYLAETHFYMKVEHEYTPADVEALLQFKDPLAVAMAAREENTRDYTFPVAEVLKEMGAYELYPLAEKPEKPEPKRSASVRDRLQAAVKELKEKPAPEAKPRDDGAR